MLALIGNLDFTEILIILVVAVMVFGERLPEVAMRGAAQLVKLRRMVGRMWREAGLDEELRRVRRDLDRQVREVPPPREIFRDIEESLEDADEEPLDDVQVAEDTREERREEPHVEQVEAEEGAQESATGPEPWAKGRASAKARPPGDPRP